MIDSKAIIEKTNAFYEKKRTETEFLNQAEEERLEENAEYSALKYHLRELKIDRQKALFVGNIAPEADAAIEKAEAEFKILKEKLKKNAPTSAPSCAICSDKGTVNGELCECYYKRLNKNAYEFLGIKDKKMHSFKDDTLSLTEGKTSVFSAIKKFVDKIPGTDRNVLLIGQKGTGKTFLTECAVNFVNQKRSNAIYLSAFNLNAIFVKDLSVGFADKITTNEILTTCDLLAIDDLGTEPVYNKVTIENLTSLISERLDNGKPFLINTNLDLAEISERYGERLYSRLCGKKTVILKMDGKDLRFI